MIKKLHSYRFITIWKKGKQHAIPDALFRAPVDTPDSKDKAFEEDVEHHLNFVSSSAI